MGSSCACFDHRNMFLLAILTWFGHSFCEPVHMLTFMNKFFLLTTTIISLGLAPAMAQPAPRGGAGPNFGGAMNKLFGANQTFSSAMEFQTTSPNGNNISMPGKIAFDAGKSRFEMNMSEMKGAQMPPPAQMKAMGMETMISISRPDLKLTYLIYPGLNSYASMASQDPSVSASPDDFKLETAELGKETVDGHDCVKNKVTVTDKDGTKTESTVWNATDLKNFPVKIVTSDTAHPATILFKNISFAKPAASLFEPPAGLTKYDSVQTMMQTEMAKHMGAAGGMPPAQH